MNKQSSKKILIVSAHADDHLTCAGTIFKLQDQGYEVYEAVLTNSGEGNDKRKGKVLNKPREVMRLRADEFDKASQFLGTKRKFMFMEEDLDLQFSKEIMLKLVKIIREVQPKVIFTMNETDYHKDHITAAKIVQEASFWSATGIRTELGKPHRTDCVLYGEGMLPIEPDVLVDITGYEQKKMELFRIYESQANSKSTLFTDSLMRVRGYHIRKRNLEFAEAFNLNKKFPSLLFD